MFVCPENYNHFKPPYIQYSLLDNNRDNDVKKSSAQAVSTLQSLSKNTTVTEVHRTPLVQRKCLTYEQVAILDSLKDYLEKVHEVESNPEQYKTYNTVERQLIGYAQTPIEACNVSHHFPNDQLQAQLKQKANEGNVLAGKVIAVKGLGGLDNPFTAGISEGFCGNSYTIKVGSAVSILNTEKFVHGLENIDKAIDTIASFLRDGAELLTPDQVDIKPRPTPKQQYKYFNPPIKEKSKDFREVIDSLNLHKIGQLIPESIAEIKGNHVFSKDHDGKIPFIIGRDRCRNSVAKLFRVSCLQELLDTFEKEGGMLFSHELLKNIGAFFEDYFMLNILCVENSRGKEYSKYLPLYFDIVKLIEGNPNQFYHTTFSHTPDWSDSSGCSTMGSGFTVKHKGHKQLCQKISFHKTEYREFSFIPAFSGLFRGDEHGCRERIALIGTSDSNRSGPLVFKVESCMDILHRFEKEGCYFPKETVRKIFDYLKEPYNEAWFE